MNDLIEKKLKSSLHIYAFGLCFLIVSFIFPMYKLFSVLLGIILSSIAAVLVYTFDPGKTIMVEAPLKEADTGNEALNKLITNGRLNLKQIETLGKTIDNKRACDDVAILVSYGSKIFDLLEERPEKASSVRRFMDYYLPTALKLVESYSGLKAQKAEGENIVKASAKIEEALHMAVEAFKKQFDSLFEADAMDIIAEINVMEKLLKAEGLLQDGFASQKKAGGV